MAHLAITDQVLQRATPPKKGRLELWDAYVEGFGYRATRRGHGSFFVRFRLDGRQRRFTLGAYPAMALEDGRQAAREALAKVRAGTDPAVTRNADQDAAQRARSHTVTVALDEFLRLYPRYRPSTRAEVGRLLRRELLPRLGTMPITAVGRRDVASVINAVADLGHGTTANRLFAYLQAFFRWLVERGELDATPMAKLSKPAPERARDRVLRDDELAAVWHAAVAMGAPFGDFVRLLILTAQRRGEVASMRPQDLQLRPDVQHWTLPREHTKSDRQHVVPLAWPAVEIVAGLLRRIAAPDGSIIAGDALLFAATYLRRLGIPGARHISGWSTYKAKLDARAAFLLQQAEDDTARREGRAPSKVSMAAWTLHDLRRTAASGMAALGVAPHVVERLLNHSNGTIRGVAAVYNRHSYLPEMRQAADAWAIHVLRLAQPDDARVVRLRQRAVPAAMV